MTKAKMLAEIKELLDGAKSQIGEANMSTLLGKAELTEMEEKLFFLGMVSAYEQVVEIMEGK